MEVKVFESPEKLAVSFAEYFSNEVNKSEVYHIALSGGSTPKMIFSVLAENYFNKINWSKVHFYWGDERCVSPDNDESNYKTAKELLFNKINISYKNIHRIKGENNPAKEAKEYSDILLEFLPSKNSLPNFDFVMLGVGEDGHTASIFPDRLDLFESTKICEAVKHPVSNQNRITITGKVINNADKVAFFVTGKSKSFIVKRILGGSNESKAYPSAHVNPASKNLYWYLDKEAFSF